jgi:hypothetical protein
MAIFYSPAAGTLECSQHGPVASNLHPLIWEQVRDRHLREYEHPDERSRWRRAVSHG